MTREFNVIIEKGEDGYLVSEVIGMPGCHTQAKTVDELMKRTKEAISLYIKCTKEIPAETFVGFQKLMV